MIGVVIATYGDRDEWAPYIHRATASVDEQPEAQPFLRVWSHGRDLASARNDGALRLAPTADHLIFLDADDELDSGYIAAMEAAVLAHNGEACLYRPSVLTISEDGSTDGPVMAPRTDMRRANCCVIGSMVPARLFRAVGGFGPYPILEDWALFRALLAVGTQIVDVPAAVYRVHEREGSRNSQTAGANEVYRQIRSEVPL